MSPTTDSFEEIESAVVRFAGDSGDGMQTVGERFTDSSAFAGNDIATLPDFPAEIRAPCRNSSRSLWFSVAIFEVVKSHLWTNRMHLLP